MSPGRVNLIEAFDTYDDGSDSEMKGTDTMIVLVANYYTQEGKDDEVAEVLKKMVAYCNSDEEPGCLQYVVNRSIEDPRKFLLFEQYVDEDAVTAHRATDMFQEHVLGTVVPMLDHREPHFYTVVEPD